MLHITITIGTITWQDVTTIMIMITTIMIMITTSDDIYYMV